MPGVYEPGLYSWWIDAAGASELAEGLREPLAQGLIYVGQTGAVAKFGRGGNVSTLADRVAGSHIIGPSRHSTLRVSLFGCLRDRHDLRLAAYRRLEPESEQVLTTWMRSHLFVAIWSHPVREELRTLEAFVADQLDPPLNLEGRPSSPARDRLRQLRREFNRDPSTGEVRSRGKRAVSATGSSQAARPAAAARRRTMGDLTLHMEIAAILAAAGSVMTTEELAQAVNARGLYGKADGSAVTAFQIHGRTRKYSDLFIRHGSTVGLR